MKTVYVIILLVPISIVIAYSSIHPLKTALDYNSLDKNIVKRMTTSSKDVWEGMVDDIVFYTHSLVNLVGSLEQNVTKDELKAAFDLMDGGKPAFIDTQVEEEKVMKKLNLEEFDIYRFATLRMDAVNQWNNFVSFVSELKANQTYWNRT